MIKVYAYNVKDLTVARYFAAMNVDLLGFKISKENKNPIKEIIEWVEGPKIVLEIEDANFLDEASLDVPAHFIYLVEEAEWHPGKLYAGEKFPSCIEIEDASILSRIRISSETQNYFKVEKIGMSLIEQLNAMDSGIMLTAGIEDIPGIKSFDEMDEIFEIINAK